MDADDWRHRLVVPDVGEAELAAIGDAFETGTLSTGDLVATFESEFAAFADRSDAAAVCSGSTALELGLRASDLAPGDRVLVSPFNCSAVIYALVRADLDPVYVDVDAGTFNLSPSAARRRLNATNEPVNGLLVTHLYGQPCDMDGLLAVADEYDLTVVEDCCQAPGAEYDGQRIGSYGSFSVYSFGATKNITTAEGGVVVSDDSTLLDGVRTLRSNSGVDETPPPGNVVMSDVEAAMGLTQLERYPTLLGRRRDLAAVYREHLPEQVTLQTPLDAATHVYHRLVVTTEHRDDLLEHLRHAGIEATPAITRLLSTYDCSPPAATSLRNATAATERGLLLPLHTRMEPDDAREIVETVRAFSD